MKGKFVITYSWNRVDGQPVKEEHVEALEESAWDRVNEMAGDGYTSGELNAHIHMTESDPEDGVHYRGWWSLETATAMDSQPEATATAAPKM